MRQSMSVAVLICCCATSAWSQTSSPPTPIAAQRVDQFSSVKFRGTEVLAVSGQKIGEIEDIIFDNNGKVDAYVVSVGGFLGVGAKRIALPPKAFAYFRVGNNVRLSIDWTKEQFIAAPTFKYYEPPSR